MGPLVVAGVLCDDQDKLRRLGVRDSKKLTPQRRRGLDLEIRRIAEVRALSVGASELDSAMDDASLNVLEAGYFAQLIREMAPDEAIVDCADTSQRRFKTQVLRHLGFELPILSEHRADDRYPVVSAASIVAKVKRDEEMRHISEKLGQPVGSGYAHDPQTVSFLKRYIMEEGRMPPHVRKGWKTSKRLISDLKLRKLSEWD